MKNINILVISLLLITGLFSCNKVEVEQVNIDIKISEIQLLSSSSLSVRFHKVVV